MAHKKGQGSTQNNRDSAGRRLGIKKFGGEVVRALVQTIEGELTVASNRFGTKIVLEFPVVSGEPPSK